MKRVEFLQVAALTPLISFTLLPGLAKALTGKSLNRNLKAVVINNRELVSSVGLALDHLGGIGQFVNKRSRVVIKPSMAYNQKPGTGYNSDPALVEHLIRLCYTAGAREVSVFDHTIDDWTLCYKNSGIERVAKNAEARVLPANEFMYYMQVPESVGKQPDPLHVHQAIILADVIINVGVSGIHKGREAGGAVENFTRCAWEQNITGASNNQLYRLLSYKKPVLNFIEVWESTPGDIETSTTLTRQKMIASTDLVIADLVLSGLMTPDYMKVKGLEQAIQLDNDYQQPLSGQILYIK